MVFNSFDPAFKLKPAFPTIYTSLYIHSLSAQSLSQYARVPRDQWQSLVRLCRWSWRQTTNRPFTTTIIVLINILQQPCSFHRRVSHHGGRVECGGSPSTARSAPDTRAAAAASVSTPRSTPPAPPSAAPYPTPTYPLSRCRPLSFIRAHSYPPSKARPPK